MTLPSSPGLLRSELPNIYKNWLQKCTKKGDMSDLVKMQANHYHKGKQFSYPNQVTLSYHTCSTAMYFY